MYSLAEFLQNLKCDQNNLNFTQNFFINEFLLSGEKLIVTLTPAPNFVCKAALLPQQLDFADLSAILEQQAASALAATSLKFMVKESPESLDSCSLAKFLCTQDKKIKQENACDECQNLPLPTEAQTKTQNISEDIAANSNTVPAMTSEGQREVDKDLSLSSGTNCLNDKSFHKKHIWGTRSYADFQLRALNAPLIADDKIVLRGQLFAYDYRELAKAKDRSLLVLDIYDGAGCSQEIACFPKSSDCEQLLDKLKDLVNQWIAVYCSVYFSDFDKKLNLSGKGITTAKAPDSAKKRVDTASEKRVELHAHTKNSQEDGIADPEVLVARAAEFGHPAVAITDHGVVQSFPAAFETRKKLAKAGKDIKILYGVEGYKVFDGKVLCHGLADEPEAQIDNLASGLCYLRVNQSDDNITVDYELFDLPENFSEIAASDISTEEGLGDAQDLSVPAWSTKSGSFSFDNTDYAKNIRLREFATAIKHRVLLITDRRELALLRRAAFAPGEIKSTSDMKHAYYDNYELKPRAKFFMPYILSSELQQAYQKAFGADAEALTPNVKAERDLPSRLMSQLFCLWIGKGEKSLAKLNLALGKNDYAGRRELKTRSNHIIAIAKNSLGLYNLYRMVSYGLTDGFYRRPLIPASIFEFFREDIILGSACVAGEVFQSILALYRECRGDIALIKKELNTDKYINLARFYDYLEIQPRTNNLFLTVASSRNPNPLLTEDLQKLNELVVYLGNISGIKVCATCDCHFVDPEDEIYRKILTDKRSENSDEEGGALFLRTTDEMLSEFSYLGDEKAYEVVVTNPQAVAAAVDADMKPFPSGSYPPNIEGADVKLQNLVNGEVEKLYAHEGKVPDLIAERMHKELSSIIDNGYAIMYYIAARLVKKSNDDGYIVGSRGSVGSSFVATLAGITEVNPLPPHYRCPSCNYTEFCEDASIGSGFDMPPKYCPCCGTPMLHDGQNIPFETFLGFKGDKQPDIDLNFSGIYQPRAHKFIEEMFGAEYTFRAGTISGYADKNAMGIVLSYCENHNLEINNAEKKRLAMHIVGAKKTTGQHPGGIVVVPKEYEIYDFTPIQYPANKRTYGVITTHFDFNAMHDTLLKLDILGHVDPSMLKMLTDLTGVDLLSIPIPDAKVMALFNGAKSLGIANGDRYCGTIGLPELGTFIVRDMIKEAKPQKYDNLVQLSGLSHGTGVWKNNAQDLIKKGICDINEVIGCRDGIMTTLLGYGLAAADAFQIMERVRKGRGLEEHHIEIMQSHKVPEWYIDSCLRIKYMFPRAHAVAYTISAMRIGWFKVYKPEAYYAAWLTLRSNFDAETMVTDLNGIEKVLADLKNRMSDRSENKNDLTDKYYTAEIIQEMLRRNIKLLPVSLLKSDATDFLIENPGEIRVPFAYLSGISTKSAPVIVQARSEKMFTDVEDLKLRAHLSSAVIETLRKAGALDGLPESSQLSFFDLMQKR